MRTFHPDDCYIDAVLDALCNGDGAVRVRGPFSADQRERARASVMKHSEHEGPRVTHFKAKGRTGGAPRPAAPGVESARQGCGFPRWPSSRWW